MKLSEKIKNPYYLISLISLFFLAIVIICLIPCYFFGAGEWPNGIALGGLVNIILFTVTGITEARGKFSLNKAQVIVTQIIRILVFTAVLVLVGLMYYLWNVKAFNIFGVVIGYTITLIAFVIVLLKVKKD